MQLELMRLSGEDDEEGHALNPDNPTHSGNLVKFLGQKNV